jgi:hypothetical protein
MVPSNKTHSFPQAKQDAHATGQLKFDRSSWEYISKAEENMYHKAEVRSRKEIPF